MHVVSTIDCDDSRLRLREPRFAKKPLACDGVDSVFWSACAAYRGHHVVSESSRLFLTRWHGFVIARGDLRPGRPRESSFPPCPSATEWKVATAAGEDVRLTSFTGGKPAL
jgi:hypothetical protein